MPENLKFKYISLEEGLSNGLVRCIIQDKRGYMWIGTDDGLNRYNGKNFVIYRHDPVETGSIISNSISQLLEDSRGRLWVATEGGLDLYDPYLDRFIHYKDARNAIIQTLYEDFQGVLWVGTSRGLAILADTVRELQYVDMTINNTQSTRPFSLADFSVTVLMTPNKHQMIVGTWSGLLVFDRRTKKIDWLRNTEDDEKSLPDDHITSMVPGSGTRIWVGTNSGGLVSFDLSAYSFKQFPLTDKRILALSADDYGNLWVGTEQSGLLKILSDSLQSLEYQYKYYKAQERQGSLSYRTVTTIYIDREKNMWVGTYGEGINFASANPDFFNSIQRIPSLSNTLAYKKVWGLCEDDDGNIWIGTDGGGLNRYDVKTGLFTYYNHIASDKNTISDHAILSAAKDVDGALWFGTYAGGLNRFGPGKNRFIRYQHLETDSTSLGSNDVRVIFPDSQNNLWVGTNQGGLNLFDRATGKFKRYTTGNSRISGNDIRSIYEDKKGRLWIGTYQRGFNQFYQGKFSAFALSGLENSSINCNTVFSICEDPAGNIWLGTNGGGLVRFSPETKQFKIYTEKQGLSNNIVHAIVPDSSGNFWITTNNGISKFNLERERFENFDTKDGLPSKVFNDGSGLKSSSGIIYFGSLNGLVYFDPAALNEGHIPPPDVALEKLRVFNKEMKPTEKKNGILRKEIRETGEISLNHQQTVFSIDYAALSFAHAQKVQYAYKLIGIEKDWNYVGSRTSASYTTLPAGQYTFSVMASHDGINWTRKPRNLVVSIQPAPWKTWWAYTLYLAIIFAILYASRRYKLNKVALQNRLKIEKLERKKISEVHDLKMKFFTNVSHELRTPLTLIISPLQDIIHKSSLHPAVRKRLSHMYNHTHRLLNLVNQLMEFRKAETDHLQLKACENDIVKFTYVIYESFADVARINKTDFIFESEEDEMLLWFDQNHFEIILYNLISNAFKYTPDKGKIKISIKRLTGKKNTAGQTMVEWCEIKVTDSGKGISPEHVNRIFDRYYQVTESDTIGVMGTGIGLALVKDLVNLHHGVIDVTSQKGVSTAISLRFPLGRGHFSDQQLILAPEKVTTGKHREFPEKTRVQTTMPGIVKDGSEHKLLLVEDNAEIRDYVRSIFEKEYFILEAEDGKNGLALAKEEVPDMIISDIMMPGLNGIDFCKQLKANVETSHIPVMLLTAKASDQHKIEGISTGADAYLTKPFSAELLKAEVNGLLRNRKKLKEYYSKNITLQPNNIDITTEEEAFLQHTMEVVEANLSDESFGVKELMDALCMSQPTLYRKIKALTGESPSEFIRSIRLKTAAKMLKQGKSSIAQVSYDVGFNSVRYFRDCFKNQFGKTPSEYLKDQQLSV